MRWIDADSLLAMLDHLEKDAEEHPEVGLKPAPMIRRIRQMAEEMVVTETVAENKLRYRQEKIRR